MNNPEGLNRPEAMPAPVVAPINEVMFAAAAEGRLSVQRCVRCGAHRYPPAEGCYRCGGLDWAWSDLPGTGTVYSYTWIPDRGRDGRLYNVAVVDVDGTEGDPVRVLANVVDAWCQGEIVVGQRVEMIPVPFGDRLALPGFRRLQ